MNHSPTRIEIPRFPGGKRIAITFSFDDGQVHDRRVVEAFNQWGLKGTFNLNSRNLGKPNVIEASEVESLFRGHEVAIHTVTHPHLPLLDATQVVREVIEDRIALENLVGYPVRGMAYPFGTYDQRVVEILRALGVVYCRTTENHPQPFPPKEPLAWPATMHQYHEIDGLNMAQHFAKLHENERWSGVFFVWGHSYEFNNRDDWDALERLFKPLSGHDDVWYCTNIELFDYESARQRMVVAANRASVYNPNGLSVTVKVDGELIEVSAGQTVSLVKYSPVPLSQV